MRAAVFTAELVQLNLRRLVAESPLSTRSLALTSGINPDRLLRGLNSTVCNFTVNEVASITRALGQRMEALFEEHEDMRPCATVACVEAEHDWSSGAQFAPCRLEKIEGHGFTVHGHLLEDGWTAWVDADELDDAHQGIDQARNLVKAFEKMQARCDELNGQQLERRTSPGRPAAEELAGVGL